MSTVVNVVWWLDTAQGAPFTVVNKVRALDECGAYTEISQNEKSCVCLICIHHNHFHSAHHGKLGPV